MGVTYNHIRRYCSCWKSVGGRWYTTATSGQDLPAASPGPRPFPLQVRSVAYCGDGGTVTYGMIGPGSHFCTHIGRMHRSNHIYLLLDFATGGYCQKCYDPDCAGELGGAATRDAAMLTVGFEGHHCQSAATLTVRVKID